MQCISYALKTSHIPQEVVCQQSPEGRETEPCKCLRIKDSREKTQQLQSATPALPVGCQRTDIELLGKTLQENPESGFKIDHMILSGRS